MITAEQARLRVEKYKQTRPLRELETALAEIERSSALGYLKVTIKITYEQNKRALEDNGFTLNLIEGDSNRGRAFGGYFLVSWKDIDENTIDNSADMR